MKLTHTQKLHALAYRFYQGAAWTPKAGDFYTTSRADLEVYQVVSVEGGIVRTRFTEGSDAISEWPEAGFLTEGFGPKRVFVPEWVMNLKSACSELLEWKVTEPSPRVAVADTPHGRYTIKSVLPGYMLHFPDASVERLPSITHAEHRAQSHYDRLAAALSTQPAVAVPDGLLDYYQRQIVWSRETFGPAMRTKGVIDHIRKELLEIENAPHDLSEWVDVVILAMDGFWRHGGNAEDLFPALLAKQRKNMARAWPDWRTMSEDTAIEHDRSGEAALAAPQPAPQPVAVKPLEWFKTQHGFWHAERLGAVYEVFDNPEAEKHKAEYDAADADRILSALTTHPADLREENERLKAELRAAKDAHLSIVRETEQRVKALEYSLQANREILKEYVCDCKGPCHAEIYGGACGRAAYAALKGGE